jgi:hypothetical protein
MVDSLTAFLGILIFYTLISICSMIQLLADRYRARKRVRNVAVH